MLIIGILQVSMRRVSIGQSIYNVTHYNAELDITQSPNIHIILPYTHPKHNIITELHCTLYLIACHFNIIRLVWVFSMQRRHLIIALSV